MDSKKYFNEVAGQWDNMRETFFSNNVRQAAIKAAAINPVPIAADIGAGTGFITKELVRRGIKVIAVDQSQKMVDEMRKHFADIDSVDIRLGESEALPIDNDSVDYVFANMYLHHVEVPRHAIKEMARILQPGGKLVITDLDQHQHDFLKVEHHDRWMGFRREDVRSWFLQTGFSDVVVDCVGENCCTTSKQSGENAEVSIFIATGIKPNPSSHQQSRCSCS
jgi:ubiquinone/menaquinone biosynthesis C-methylase UbiE